MDLRRTLPLPAIALALGAAGCGDDGRSKEAREQQARTTVCAARADISTQVTTLQGLEPALTSVAQVKTSVSAILSDLAKIKDAQPDLDTDTREQVQEANQQFADEARAVTKATLSGGLAGDLGAQLTPAIDQLAATYKSVFTPIDC